MATAPHAAARRTPARAWALLLALLVAVLLAWIASGPYLAVHAIRRAVQANDAAALAANIDFPALRASLKAQLEDRLARRVDPEFQSSLLGGIGMAMASGTIDGAVETMVTPYGLGAVMQGRVLWSHFDGAPGGGAQGMARASLQDLHYRLETPSRFTATAHTASGDPVVLVLTRRGLRWRLSDLQLPR